MALASPRLFLGIGVSKYEHAPPFGELKKVSTDLKELGGELTSLGFNDVPMPLDGDSDTIRRAVSDWIDQRQKQKGGAVMLVCQRSMRMHCGSWHACSRVLRRALVLYD